MVEIITPQLPAPPPLNAQNTMMVSRCGKHESLQTLTVGIFNFIRFDEASVSYDYFKF